MDAMQVGLPILGIVAAAAITFYAVSFSEIREVPSSAFYLLTIIIIFKLTSSSFHPLISSLFGVFLNLNSKKSFRDLEESESENGGFKSSMSSRKRRASRKAEKQDKFWPRTAPSPFFSSFSLANISWKQWVIEKLSLFPNVLRKF